MAESVQQVVSALNVLYENPDAGAKEKANTWLSEFQKSNEAWSTAQLILFAPDAPIQPKLFAAQTFRTKITYDLDQLPLAHRLPLRDSLLTALRTFASGPRVILTQICIALADLALQLSSFEWSDPTSSMIESLGKDPTMAGALLEFLQVLAEEYVGNLKIQVVNDFGQPGKKIKGADGVETIRGSEQAEQVVGLLSMYATAPGITTNLQNQCFACLGAWLRSGQASSASVAGSAILTSAFTALSNPGLFDSAVDVLVDIIHETQELQDNMGLIAEILVQLVTLGPAVEESKEADDDDRMRGYCRILVEAGEWYEPLIVKHPESFLPLVQLILQCASYDNLDVVGITLNFWYRLAKGLRKVREDPASRPLLEIFATLVSTIIKHLHYPDDSTKLVGQERDDFKSFRHTIGDTLKDCCGVLGATACLKQSYDIISQTLSSSGGNTKWQEVEAPLFSMRSMGAEVDPHDNEVMPLIMDLLPKLPSHPKIRYAAILVIGRYTEWIDCHPEHIQFQLPYVSSGFEDSDQEVSAAAAQTMKYLCKDCSHHLVPFLPQLHTFIQSLSGKLAPEDLLDLAAAIAHIIYIMPPEEAPQALSLFCMPNVEIVLTIASQPTIATSKELASACDALSRLDMYLSIIGNFNEPLPPSCQGTCEQIWQVLDLFLSKYGQDPLVAEKTCIVLRRGLQFFYDEAFRVASTVLARLTDCFEKTPASSYLWITGKMVTNFSSRRDDAFVEAVGVALEHQSAKMFVMLQSTSPDRVADVLDDYVHLLSDIIEYQPQLLFLSPVFPSAFQSVLSAFTLLSPAIVLSALDTIRAIIGHDCLQFDPSDSNPPPFASAFPHFALAIRSTIEGSMLQLVGSLLDGLVRGLEDTASNVLTAFRLLSIQFGASLQVNIPLALEGLNNKALSGEVRAEFLGRFNAAVATQNPNHVKESFTWLLRASKKGRERARDTEVART